jgi:hypothetical protein
MFLATYTFILSWFWVILLGPLTLGLGYGCFVYRSGSQALERELDMQSKRLKDVITEHTKTTYRLGMLQRTTAVYRELSIRYHLTDSRVISIIQEHFASKVPTIPPPEAKEPDAPSILDRVLSEDT